MRTIITAHFNTPEEAEKFFYKLHSVYSDVKTLKMPLDSQGNIKPGYYQFQYSQKRKLAEKHQKGQ